MSVEEAIRAISRHRPLLVASDYDGTLSYLVARPEEATLHPEALRLMRDIANQEDVTVAVISGRRLDELRRMLGPVPAMTLVGEHGNDWGDATESSPVLQAVVADLSETANAIAGSHVETKRNSVAFHYRGVTQADVGEALSRVKEVAARHPVHILEGKMVIELSMADATKADAVDRLRAASTRVVFFGDDVTDEEVFRHLNTDDVGVRVGEGETAAQFRVDGVDDVVRLLQLLAEEMKADGPIE